MKIIRKIKSLRKEISRLRAKNKSIGFVPTMGALHEGHLSLMRAAGRQNDVVVASIFVNPSQFGPREDFKKYPRDIKRDASFCESCGVDIIFYPDTKEMYPQGYNTCVNVEGLGSLLCGAARPGHFKGVATIVTKLLNIASPDRAYFGQKDAQQAIIINRLASDLNIPVKIKVMPTVREKDGLALSSRNVYLSRQERGDAVILFKALSAAKELIRNGEREAAAVISAMKSIIQEKKNARIDYVSIVDMLDLKPVDRIKKKTLIALAVYIGKTRLIDNL